MYITKATWNKYICTGYLCLKSVRLPEVLADPGFLEHPVVHAPLELPEVPALLWGPGHRGLLEHQCYLGYPGVLAGLLDRALLVVQGHRQYLVHLGLPVIENQTLSFRVRIDKEFRYSDWNCNSKRKWLFPFLNTIKLYNTLGHESYTVEQ